MNQATLLYVSDDPEPFTQHGRLFHAQLPSDGRVARILFDHVNAMATPMRLVAAIVNTGGAPASIDVSGGSGGPDTNGMEAGHAATQRFFQARYSANGGVSTHTVPPGGAYQIANAVLKPNECCTGLYDVDPHGSDGLEVRVIACDPSHPDISAYDVLPEAPMTVHERRGVYVIPGAAEQVLDYDGATVTFPIGNLTYPRDQQLDPVPHAGPLKGEYGVLKRIVCNVRNGGGAAMYQTPRAGAATGTYYLDSKVLASHAVPNATRSKIAVFDTERARSSSSRWRTSTRAIRSTSRSKAMTWRS
jgi:hypothetical protein